MSVHTNKGNLVFTKMGQDTATQSEWTPTMCNITGWILNTKCWGGEKPDNKRILEGHESHNSVDTLRTHHSYFPCAPKKGRSYPRWESNRDPIIKAGPYGLCVQGVNGIKQEKIKSLSYRKKQRDEIQCLLSSEGKKEGAPENLKHKTYTGLWIHTTSVGPPNPPARTLKFALVSGWECPQVTENLSTPVSPGEGAISVNVLALHRCWRMKTVLLSTEETRYKFQYGENWTYRPEQLRTTDVSPSPLKMSSRNHAARGKQSYTTPRSALEGRLGERRGLCQPCLQRLLTRPLLPPQSSAADKGGGRETPERRRDGSHTGLGADLNYLQEDEVHLKSETMKQQKEGEQGNQSMDPRQGTEKDAHLKGSLLRHSFGEERKGRKDRRTLWNWLVKGRGVKQKIQGPAREKEHLESGRHTTLPPLTKTKIC